MNSGEKCAYRLGSLHPWSPFFSKKKEELSDFKTSAEIFHVKSVAQRASIC